MSLIESIFDKIETQGVDTKANLLYGYFFFDKDKSKLERLKNDLTAQGYRFVDIEKKGDGDFMLHVEKVEQHSRKTLYDRAQYLNNLVNKYGVSSYDGFDLGNTDPTKPLITNESFLKYLKIKRGNELFDIGIRLYEQENYEKAEIVFKECVRLDIKPDTSSFKLGNILIGQNKIEDGIKTLEEAIKFNPNYLNAYFNLGAICYDNMQFQKSILYYQQADKLSPNDDNIIYGIAASQYAIQKFDISLENCERALAINKHNENAKQLLEMLKGKTN